VDGGNDEAGGPLLSAEFCIARHLPLTYINQPKSPIANEIYVIIIIILHRHHN